MAAETKRERAASAIRAMRMDDATQVAAILRGAPEAVFWAEDSIRETLGSQNAVGLVSAFERDVTGFLIARQAADEAEILNLAVEKGSRHEGEGTALLHAVMELLRARGVKRVFLEVRESNKVGIAFYTKHGFSESGRRAGYYREPEEAACVMERKLTE